MSFDPRDPRYAPLVFDFLNDRKPKSGKRGGGGGCMLLLAAVVVALVLSRCG